MHDDGGRHSGASATRRVAGSLAGEPAGEGSLEVVTTADGAEWQRVLDQVEQYDFHHLAGYHRLAEEHGEGTALLLAYRRAGRVIGLPLLIRALDRVDSDSLRDATSVYGYAGPVASPGPLPPGMVDGFQDALRTELARRRVVSVFSRLHPLLEQRELVAGLGEIHDDGQTVSVDLTLSPEEQWAGYSKTTRRLIRRAGEAGVECVHDPELHDLAAWSDLYQATMERVGASSAYLYDRAYFERMAEELGPVLHLFVARVDGEVAAAGLFTLCQGIVQAHLGGSSTRYASLSPVRVVDDTARRWADAAGARVFHLGGGVGGREDSLFRYKTGFSDRRHRFSTWRWIVDADAYARLCETGVGDGGVSGGSGTEYFPAYRRPQE